MAGDDKKKKTESLPLRNILGTYDQMNVSTPFDQNLSMIGSGQPVNLSTMLLQPKQKVVTKPKKEIPGFDPRMSVNPATLNQDRILSPGEVIDKTKGFLGNVLSGDTKPKKRYDEFGQLIVEKPTVKTTTPIKEEIKPKDVKKISKQVTQAIIEKKAVEDPSWFERNKKGLRDAGIILAGGLQSFGEGIKGGNQSAANEQIYQNLDAAAKSDEMELLEDPNSEASKQSQSLFKQMFGNRVKMPENMTAAQFRQMSPVFEKIDARRLAEMRANAPKTPTKSNNKISGDYRDHLNALDDTIEQAKLIKELNRTSVGSIFPDTNKTTKALSAAINSKSLNQAKTAAGPGAFTDAEREIYMPLTANADESSDTALEKIRTNVTSGMTSTLRKLDSDLRAGNINPNDYDRLVMEYDARLRAFGMGLDDNNEVVPLRGK